MSFWEDYDELEDKEKIEAWQSEAKDLRKLNAELLEKLEKLVDWSLQWTDKNNGLLQECFTAIAEAKGKSR